MWPELKFISTAPSAHNGRIVARRLKYAPHFTLSSHLRAVYLARLPLLTSSRVCCCLTRECQTGAEASEPGLNYHIGGAKEHTPPPSRPHSSSSPSLISPHSASVLLLSPPLSTSFLSLWRKREFLSLTQTQKAELCREENI